MTDRDAASQGLKSRLLADLVRTLSAGHLLQASTVAVLVGRNAFDLVQQALGGSPHGDSEVDERLQLHLRNVVTVLSVAERHFGNVLVAIHWYRTNGRAEGAQQTPESLTAAGRLEDAYRLLLRAPRALAGQES